MANDDDEDDTILLEGAPEWLVTFGDLMSLLLTFFILLFSVSEIKDPKKIYEIAQRFKGKMEVPLPVFGYTIPRFEIGPDGLLPSLMDPHFQLGQAGKRLSRIKTPEGDQVHPLTTLDNLSLRREGGIYFKHDHSYLLGEGREFLKKNILPVLIDGRFNIVLTGHAAPQEARDSETQYVLAYKRALAVHIFLISHGIQESRIEIQSDGARRSFKSLPLDGDSQERDRRVDIVIPSLGASVGING